MSETAATGPGEEFEPSFLPHPAMDRMLDAIVALSAELCAERERRAVLERVLARRGLLDDQEIEAYRATDAEVEQRRRDRDEYVRRIFGSLGKL
jgi:hypothetical protein